MRILHTADWHLNNRLGSVNLQAAPFIPARLAEISHYLDEFQVDVMIVAGDFFSQYYMKMEEIKSIMFDVNKTFSDFLKRGGTMIVISGNHDDDQLFDMLRFAMDMADPNHTPAGASSHPVGRVYFKSRPDILRLADEKGQRVQFALLPYPTLTRYPYEEGMRPRSIEEKHYHLKNSLLQKLDNLRSNLIPEIPSILVSHAYVSDTPTGTALYKLSEKEDIKFDMSSMYPQFIYKAFGHIHQPQILSNDECIRYSGSIERFDASEQEDEKGVVLFDITDNQIKDVRFLPLNSSPLYDITINDPSSQIESLLEDYQEAGRALVKCTVYYQESVHSRRDIEGKIYETFPYIYQPIKFINTERPQTAIGANTLEEALDMHSTVIEYLNSQLTDDGDREAILVAAEQLLVELED